MNRTDKSIKNLVFALIAQGVTVILSFIIRTEMIRSLGIVSVSINGLFTDVIATLSLAELGIGSAIVYNLYKPLAEGDKKKICQLMYLFKKAYTIIAAVTFAAGLALTPIIHLLIEKVDIPIGYLRIVYLLFVFQNSLSYLFAYKIALVSADQKQYIYSNINLICRVVGSIILIVVMRLTKAYIPYLIGNIAMVVTTNAIASRAVDKEYPFLVDDPSLPKEEQKALFKNVRNIFFKSLAGTVVSSTDNILISKLVGTLFVGYTSNYVLVTGVFQSLAGKAWDAMEASFANLFVTSDKEKILETIRRLTFVFFLFGIVSSVGVYACVQSFIMIWLHETSFLLPKLSVFLLCLLLFLMIVYRPLTAAMHMTGYFEIGRNISATSALVNLVVSIVLGLMIGLPGIYIGTCCTYAIEVIAKIYFVFNKYFRTSPISYVLMWIKMLSTLIVSCLILDLIAAHIPFGYIPTFLIMGLTGMALVAVFVLILFGKSDEMDYVIYMIKEYSGKLKNRA